MIERYMGGSRVSMKRRFGLVLAVSVLLTGCAARMTGMQRLQAQNSYERALSQLNQGQSALALSSLQEATTLNPRSALYHDTLGLALLDLGRIDQALAELTKAVDLDPNRGDSYFHLGTALAEARRWEDAVATYRKAIVLPSLTALDLAHQNLGLALFHLGRYREAEEALRFALSLDPQLQAAYYNLGLAVALVASLGVRAPPVMAQAPAPKVTITGLIDQVGTYTKNMSQYDANLNIGRDTQLYGRTRGRFDFIGEVGKAKAVLGIEIDSYWGQTGFTDSNNGPGWQCSTVNGSCASGAVGSGAESSFDLNTDTQGNLQIKWLYTEFPLPLVPLNSVVRLGAQPFGTAATYKLATYANGDFPGVNLVVDLAPGAKLMLTYVAVDEQLTGKRDFFPLTFGGSASTDGKCTGTPGGPTLTCIPQSRNDNWALIASFEMSPFKGLDVKPMYSYFEAVGQTSGAARQGRGGVVTASSISGVTGGQVNSPFNPIGTATVGAVGAAGAASDGAGTNTLETRHTIGVDARFTAGPFSLQPTVLYQFGHQEKWLLGGQSAPYGAV